MISKDNANKEVSDTITLDNSAVIFLGCFQVNFETEDGKNPLSFL